MPVLRSLRLPQDTVMALLPSAEAASVALARLDERLARADGKIREGFLERNHVLEAQALVGLMGAIAPLEDIVLNDAGMDVRAPTTDVVRAVSHLRLRRGLVRADAAQALSPIAIRNLLDVASAVAVGIDDAGPRPGGLRAVWEMPRPIGDDDDADPIVPDRLDDDDAPEPDEADPESLDGLLAATDRLLARSRRYLDRFNDFSTDDGRSVLTLADPAYDEAGRLDRWLEILEAAERLPAALAAAAAIDAWLMLEPSQHRGELGFLLASLVMRKRRVCALLTPALALGYRRGRFRWGPHLGIEKRLAGLLGALSGAAALGHADLDRLGLARDLLRRRTAGRSKNSRLGDLADLFIASPLVTVQLAAQSLRVSPQAVDVMLRELGDALPRELTGRKRYRAWGIL